MSDTSTPEVVTPPRALRRDAEANRVRILAAASALFAERGMDATLDEVAARAGVGVGTVYRRFPNKEALVDELFRDRMQEVVALAEAGLADADPWAGFVQYLTGMSELQACDRGLADLVMSRASHVERVAEIRELLQPLVAEMIARAQRAGLMREDVTATDLPLVAMMIRTVIVGGGDMAPELWRRAVAIVLDGLRPPGGATTPLVAPALDDSQLDEFMQRVKR